jgi:hypothetical protein
MIQSILDALIILLDYSNNFKISESEFFRVRLLLAQLEVETSSVNDESLDPIFEARISFFCNMQKSLPRANQQFTLRVLARYLPFLREWTSSIKIKKASSFYKSTQKSHTQ